MNISIKTPVGDIVRRNFRTTSVFQVHHIDYCCGGNRSLEEACQASDTTADELISELNTVTTHSDPDSDYINSLNALELTDYIVKRHHGYVKQNIPFIKNNLNKLCSVHGDNHPELNEIKRLFEETSDNLILHMQKEEIMLFPYIKRLIMLTEKNGPFPKPVFGSIANPIGEMIKEHQSEGERFDNIARLTGYYKLPVDSCATYEVTFKQLRDFENDLHRHIHLENNIVFPQAVKLEQKWKS